MHLQMRQQCCGPPVGTRELQNGATGTHNMVGGSAGPMRRIHIIGTKGEIYGDFEESKFTVAKFILLKRMKNGRSC